MFEAYNFDFHTTNVILYDLVKKWFKNGIFMVYMYNKTYFSFQIALLFVFH